MSKQSQRLSWEIRDDYSGIIDVFPFGKPNEVIMSISLSEAIQAAKQKRPGIIVDQPPIKFKINPKPRMKPTDKTVLAINGTEALAFGLWVKNHLKVCEHAKEHGNQSVDFHFEVSHASGIGQNTHVHCSCGAREEITDVGSW